MSRPFAFDISATNVTGMGAAQLVGSLLTALERQREASVWRLGLPAKGPLAHYRPSTPVAEVWRYRRLLPNAVSRAVECTVLSGRVSRRRPLLVLGDLPIRHRYGQVVLFHNRLLLAGSNAGRASDRAKLAISRSLLRFNLRFADTVIVQTETMRQGLLASFPELAGRAVVIPQPPPEWLLADRHDPPSKPRRRGPLELFYPAAPYPHKNLGLLRRFEERHPDADVRISLTAHPGRSGGDGPLLRWLGPQDHRGMIVCYRQADALVFPSLEESYGLPLVEAMFLGLPILAADLPYAHELCGDQAIYFDPGEEVSLARAILQLRQRLDCGWRADWSGQLAAIPADWDEVAQAVLAVLAAAGGLSTAGRGPGAVRPTPA